MGARRLARYVVGTRRRAGRRPSFLSLQHAHKPNSVTVNMDTLRSYEKSERRNTQQVFSVIYYYRVFQVKQYNKQGTFYINILNIY
jgi:hypothetical protein